MRYPEAARALLRDTLLDAAGELMRDRPWGKVTMGDVAAAAGVSRQTLYNEFGGRREFAQAYVLREAERFLAGVERVIDRHADDPRRALASALDLFLSAAWDHPLVAAIAGREGGEELLALVTVHGGELIASSGDRLAGHLVATWPQVSREDARIVADCLVRLAISHATLPAGPADETAGSVARVLGPLVDELLAGTATAS